jgi:hypothetical protein
VLAAVNAESWRGFEQRIQERRLQTLTDTIRGGVDAARKQMQSVHAALEEVRELCPAKPEIAELESIARDAVESFRAPRRARAPWMIAVALLVCGTAAFALWANRASASSDTAPEPHALVVHEGSQPNAIPGDVGRHEMVPVTLVDVPASTVTPERRDFAADGAAATAAPSGLPALGNGWLIVSAPLPLDLIDGDGRIIGTSETDRIALPAGQHDITFTAASFGYSSRQAVRIRAAQTTRVQMQLPTALLAVNAQPWAEVWVDGRSVGETPIGDLEQTIGEHQVEFRHPQLGVKRVTARVTLNESVRISVDMSAP